MTCIHFGGIPVFSDRISQPGKGGMSRTEVHVWKIINFCNIADQSCYWGKPICEEQDKNPFGAFRQFNM